MVFCQFHNFDIAYFQLGVIYRTISIRTRIQVFGKMILIVAMYFWMQITGEATYSLAPPLQILKNKCTLGTELLSIGDGSFTHFE